MSTPALVHIFLHLSGQHHDNPIRSPPRAASPKVVDPNVDLVAKDRPSPMESMLRVIESSELFGLCGVHGGRMETTYMDLQKNISVKCNFSPNIREIRRIPGPIITSWSDVGIIHVDTWKGRYHLPHINLLIVYTVYEFLTKVPLDSV